MSQHTSPHRGHQSVKEGRRRLVYGAQRTRREREREREKKAKETKSGEEKWEQVCVGEHTTSRLCSVYDEGDRTVGKLKPGGNYVDPEPFIARRGGWRGRRRKETRRRMRRFPHAPCYVWPCAQAFNQSELPSVWCIRRSHPSSNEIYLTFLSKIFFPLFPILWAAFLLSIFTPQLCRRPLFLFIPHGGVQANPSPLLCRLLISNGI